MREYVTDALVLGASPSAYHDRVVELYTERLGRVEARLVSGRKMTSKLSPHCAVGNRARVRLVLKNGFTVADAVVLRVFGEYVSGEFSRLHFLGAFSLLRSLEPVCVRSVSVWSLFSRGFYEGRIDCSSFFALSGYDLRLASCALCGMPSLHSFLLSDHIFLCSLCERSVSRREKVSLALLYGPS